MYQTLRALKPYAAAKNGNRIVSELLYAAELSRQNDGVYDGCVSEAAEWLLSEVKKSGVITVGMTEQAEQLLAPVAGAAKEIVIHAVGHAHIDMNWMWRYDETVNITLETFRTVFRLMEEFPTFTFSQSQASCYKIVEQYDPALLARITERVKEGRWEVTASTWVETDKNMPSGESLARHILYTKKYMHELFGLSEDDLKLDFEPDTFGHNANVPEILANGGVDYYYHCRGYMDDEIYNWQSPSGSSVLVYREPAWYNGAIEPDFVCEAPAFCKRNHINHKLKVYGVGDHGGGPTRRDLERLTDMMTWPVFPTIQFSTYRAFFDTIARQREQFKTIKQELNAVFTGCYTTQTRIKAANKLGENALFEAELLCALGSATVPFSYQTKVFESAWQDVLFNQFHDIIPGSGIIDTREHAMGRFQEVLAKANTQKSLACSALAEQIDTSAIGSCYPEATTSEGAGVGYSVTEGFGSARVERGRGKRRGYLLFNPSEERKGVFEITLWDWQGDPSLLVITDAAGKRLPSQVLTHGRHEYWQHDYLDVAVLCTLPQYGYLLVIADEDAEKPLDYIPPNAPRVHKSFEYTLENSRIKAVIDPVAGGIRALYDKESGQCVLQNANFSVVHESQHPGSGGTAWVVGRYRDDGAPFKVSDITRVQSGALRQAIKINARYGSSALNYALTLDEGDSHISVNVTCDWLETGNPSRGIPQLRFMLAETEPTGKYVYDIPFGTIVRDGAEIDMPGLSYICAEKSAIAPILLSDTKYGFRGTGNTMAITLIRSSYDPDPFPELCRHSFTFNVGAVKPEQADLLSNKINRKVFSLSVTSHEGSLAPEASLMQAENCMISGVKGAEDGNGIVVRLYNNAESETNAVITVPFEITSAERCLITETPDEKLEFNGKRVFVPMKAFGMTTVKIRTRQINHAFSQKKKPENPAS